MALNKITVFASEILCALTYSLGGMAIWCLGFESSFYAVLNYYSC